jgi:hypothetical protein
VKSSALIILLIGRVAMAIAAYSKQIKLLLCNKTDFFGKIEERFVSVGIVIYLCVSEYD